MSRLNRDEVQVMKQLPAEVLNRIKDVIDNRLTRQQRRMGDDTIATIVFEQVTQGWTLTKQMEVSWEIKHAARATLRQRREQAKLQHRVGSKTLV